MLAVAPSCVVRYYHNHIAWKEVHLRNDCPSTKYLKAIVAYGPDSGCIGLSRREPYTYRWYVEWEPSRMDRLELC